MSDLFDSTSPRFGLPLLFAGQAQKESFVNEAHALADMLMHCAIQGETETPPVDPAQGDTWLVADGPTGAWAGQAGKLAGWQSGNWLFVAPREGMRVFDLAAGQDRRYAGEWLAPVTPPAPAGGAVIDSEARTAIAALVAALQQSGIFATG